MRPAIAAAAARPWTATRTLPALRAAQPCQNIYVQYCKHQSLLSPFPPSLCVSLNL